MRTPNNRWSALIRRLIDWAERNSAGRILDPRSMSKLASTDSAVWICYFIPCLPHLRLSTHTRFFDGWSRTRSLSGHINSPKGEPSISYKKTESPKWVGPLTCHITRVRFISDRVSRERYTLLIDLLPWSLNGPSLWMENWSWVPNLSMKSVH